eukprot:6731682-Prymnesium_polylepis.1
MVSYLLLRDGFVLAAEGWFRTAEGVPVGAVGAAVCNDVGQLERRAEGGRSNGRVVFHAGQSRAIKGNPGQSRAIQSNQRQSRAIKRNQRACCARTLVDSSGRVVNARQFERGRARAYTRGSRGRRAARLPSRRGAARATRAPERGVAIKP